MWLLSFGGQYEAGAGAQGAGDADGPVKGIALAARTDPAVLSRRRLGRVRPVFQRASATNGRSAGSFHCEAGLSDNSNALERLGGVALGGKAIRDRGHLPSEQEQPPDRGDREQCTHIISAAVSRALDELTTKRLYEGSHLEGRRALNPVRPVWRASRTASSA